MASASLRLDKEAVQAQADNLKKLSDKIAKQREEIIKLRADIDENWTGPSREQGEEQLAAVVNPIQTSLDSTDVLLKQTMNFLQTSCGIVFP